MEKRSSAPARIAAALALVVAALALIVIVAGSPGGSSDGHRHHRHHPHRQAAKPHAEAKSYVVQTGDTLTAIAHRTGVSVAEIQALNPEVDPQILIAGEKLKLR